MMKQHNVQGFTLVGLLLMIAMVVYIIIVAINLIPPYLTNYSVQKCLDEMAHTASVKELSPVEVKRLLRRKLDMNFIKDIATDDLEVSHDHDELNLKLDYEVRVHIMANVDAVVSFKDEASSGS